MLIVYDEQYLQYFLVCYYCFCSMTTEIIMLFLHLSHHINVSFPHTSSMHGGHLCCICLCICFYCLFINVFFLNMVQQVKSRTKPYAYGMYWKQNRKQCIAFLALDSQLSMEAHMKWVELQIQNLETYRRGKD